MREQGRTRGVKANTLHHMHRENIHMHIIPPSKPHHCMPSDVCAPQAARTHTQKGKLRIHKRMYSTIILLYPALSISPLCSLSLPSYLKSLLHSLHHPIVSRILPSPPQFSPASPATPLPPSLSPPANTMRLHYMCDG